MIKIFLTIHTIGTVYTALLKVMEVEVTQFQSHLGYNYAIFSCSFTLMWRDTLCVTTFVPECFSLVIKPFNFRSHISAICNSCIYHIRDLRRIRRHLDLDNAKLLANALVSSRFDYCNSVLSGVVETDLTKL